MEVETRRVVTPSHVGPRDPFHPTTEVEVILTHSSGVEVVRQGYEGGYLYEYKIPDGVPLDKEVSYYLLPPFRGQFARSWYEEGANFFSVWLQTEDIDAVVRAKSLLPEVGIAFSECELVIEGDRYRVERQKYHGGWCYYVTIEFGRPWPSLYFYPEMAPTREAPVIGVEVDETWFTSTFWVTDDKVP
ncbi:hypothetical protein Ssi03_13210 [Sphaerisporangium siamense]|uniref:Uncharacterized protein n=1 Tax=Sphaerisporangium siamense TaxID=795645 RepID=A0A7W7GDD6_9ACTN|nr:hypothetical protein [Sphaerisporangium siamense]MBB4702911.1 hypothetical protein [Sphaerisporangium siamense]GII83331.1 hypothetical protein Ssi03_13210 [Sphaerisporangium siamense]